MQEHFQFDRERFKDVVHYVVHYVGRNLDPEKLGRTKLHRVLYFADMLHYLDTGAPLTGADYRRQRFGPAAGQLTWALTTLQSEGRIATATRNYYGYDKSEYRALTEPRTDRLSDAQKLMIEHLADFVCARTAAEVGEFCHDEVWSSVAMGERIPYYAALAMFPTEITDDDLAEAAEEAVRLAS
jgi:antitoxin SocA-like protein